MNENFAGWIFNERRRKMKVAYLILCHTDPKHIRRLVNKLTYKTNNECFIHIDKKSSLVDFTEELVDLPRTTILKVSAK